MTALAAWLAAHAAAALAVAGVYLEESGVPMPVPAEISIAYLGHLARPSPVALLAVWLGLTLVVTLGASNLFLVSRRWGGRLVRGRLGHVLQLTPRRLARAESWFRRWGPLAVFGSRFVPGLRFPMAVACGTLGVRWPGFALATMAAAAIWAGVMLGAGIMLGPEVAGIMSHPWLWLLIALPALTVLVTTLWRTLRWSSGASGAGPTIDPLDRHARPLVETGRARGLVVATATPHGEIMRCWGATSRTGPPVGPRTLFEIGSITKPMVGILLAEMAASGEVGLDDPIARFLPGAAWPAWAHEATLLDLATHTAGLPKWPLDYVGQAAWRLGRPPDYDSDALYRSLRRLHPRSRPGARYAYSNIGFALLGHVLALAAGASVERLLVERVCLPLGMRDTVVTLIPTLAPRAAVGHWAGHPVPPWDLGLLAGMGGLHSTGADMLRFLRANLEPGTTPLDAAIESAQRPRRPAGRDGGMVGLGWPSRPWERGRLLWHHGTTGGFRSMIALQRTSGAGVVALANSAPVYGMPLGRPVLDLMEELARCPSPAGLLTA